MYLQGKCSDSYINLQWGKQLNAFVVHPNTQHRQHPRTVITSTMIPMAPQDRFVQLDFAELEVNSGDTSVWSKSDGVLAEVGSLSEI